MGCWHNCFTVPVAFYYRPSRIAVARFPLGSVSLSEGEGPSCCFFDELWRDFDFGGWYRPCSAEKVKPPMHSLAHDGKTGAEYKVRSDEVAGQWLAHPSWRQFMWLYFLGLMSGLRGRLFLRFGVSAGGVRCHF